MRKVSTEQAADNNASSVFLNDTEALYVKSVRRMTRVEEIHLAVKSCPMRMRSFAWARPVGSPIRLYK